MQGYAQYWVQDGCYKSRTCRKTQRKDNTLSESELLTKTVGPPKKHSVALSARELDSMALCHARELEFVKKQLVATKSMRLHRSYSKIHQLTGIVNLSDETDPNRVAEIILRHLSESDLTEEEVVESFIKVLCMEKKLRKHVPQAIIS